MRTHWQEEGRLPAGEAEEVKTPPRPNNKASRAHPECPPNVKLAHRRWKASHPSSRVRRSLHESLAKSSWAPTTTSDNDGGKKAATNRALYASVHRAKATSPLCDYLRELLETSPLRDLTNPSEAGDAARTKFSVGVKRRLESLFNNESDESDDDSFADKENKSPRLS